MSGNRWEVSYDPLIPWLLAVLIATLWRADRKRVLRYMLVGLVSPLVFAALFAAEIGTDLWLGLSQSPQLARRTPTCVVRLSAASADR